MNKNNGSKKEVKNNILHELKFYFEYCLDFLERIYKNDNDNDDDDDLNLENINLKILFALTLIVIYLKTFNDFTNKGGLDNNQIEEIIKVINGTEQNPFRDMINNLNYTILFQYKIKQQGVAGILKNDVVEKFHLKSYQNFNIDKNKENDINKFDKEYNEYKNLSIYIKNVYDIYSLLVVDRKHNNDIDSEKGKQGKKIRRVMHKLKKEEGKISIVADDED